MRYTDYTFYGTLAAVQAAIDGQVNVIGPLRVDAPTAQALNLSLGGLSLTLLLSLFSTPKYFARVRTADTMPAPPSGCTMCAEPDAQKTVGVFA